MDWDGILPLSGEQRDQVDASLRDPTSTHPGSVLNIPEASLRPSMLVMVHRAFGIPLSAMLSIAGLGKSFTSDRCSSIPVLNSAVSMLGAGDHGIIEVKEDVRGVGYLRARCERKARADTVWSRC